MKYKSCYNHHDVMYMYLIFNFKHLKNVGEVKLLYTKKIMQC